MLTKSDALALLERELQRQSPPDEPWVVDDSETIEETTGWVFFYNTKEYLDTGNFSSHLARNRPVMVNKYDGTVTFYGTAYFLEHYIEDYERKLSRQDRH